MDGQQDNVTPLRGQLLKDVTLHSSDHDRCPQEERKFPRTFASPRGEVRRVVDITVFVEEREFVTSEKGRTKMAGYSIYIKGFGCEWGSGEENGVFGSLKCRTGNDG